MLGGQFPASAANSLIQGYCEDFVGFAAVLAQTLEQVSMRNIDLKPCRGDLERIENGMRNLAEAIHDLLQRQPQKGGERSARAAEAPTPMAAQAPAQVGKSSPATLPPAPAPAKSAAPSNSGYVHVDMRPEGDDEARPAEPKVSKAQSPATNPPKSAVPAPAAKKDAPADKPAAPPAANTPAPAAPTPATPPTTAPAPAPAAATNQASTPTPAAPAAPASTPRAVAAPAKRAKAAAPGTGPRPAAAPAAAGDRRIGPRAQARPENLKGTNRSMPLLSVMQFLGRMRKRGTMKVQLPGELLTFEIENGCVMAAMSDKCPRDERLGDILCDMDVCTREQLEPLELLVESGAAAERFGQLVLEHGFASDQQIVAALEAQVRTRFSRACKHPESAYEFVEGERNSAPPAFPVQPLAIA